MSPPSVVGPPGVGVLLAGRTGPDGAPSFAGLAGAVLSLVGSRQAAARAVQAMDHDEAAHGDQPIGATGV